VILKLISVGKTKDAPLRALVEEYLQRLRRRHEVAWIEVRKEGGGKPQDETVRREGERVLKAVGDAALVLLDEKGELVSSRALAARWDRWSDGGVRETAFVVGGAYGHGPEVRARAYWNWSLSPLTFTHRMVPLMVAEQLYRADAIRHGEPYHHD
jgi:23S rRNA (pseudouridine1915-N3)-methyltransferase